MSSYLNFYLVPKQTIKKYVFNNETATSEEQEVKLSEGKPILLMSYSRSTNIYEAFDEALNPVFDGGEEDQYTELDNDKMQEVINEWKSDIAKTEQRLATSYKMLKEGGYSSELWEDIHSGESYLNEQKETLNILIVFREMFYETFEGYTEFEKVLINID